MGVVQYYDLRVAVTTETWSIASRWDGRHSDNPLIKEIGKLHKVGFFLVEENLFIKYFTNFVSIKPNLSGDIQDKIVHSLSIAKQNLLDKNLEETINQFSSLSSGEYFFASWIEQAEYYIEVTNILNKLLD